MVSGEDWVAGDDIELDQTAVADSVRRCVEVATLVSVFQATDESVMGVMQRSGGNPGMPVRVYPAGYVEDLFEQIATILKGEDSVIDAEAHED